MYLQTLTEDVRRVKMKHGFPKVSDYVRMVIHLKRVDGDCETDLFISTRYQSFSIMVVF